MTANDKIYEAADKLDFQGKAVTLASLRTELGGGSYTTINPALKEWKARKAEKTQLPPAPEELCRRMVAFGAELWNQACKIAESRFVGERMALEEQIQQLESNLTDAVEAADSAETAKELANKKVDELKTAIEPIKAKLDEQNKRATELEIRYQESEYKINILQSVIDRLDKQNTELNAKNSELTIALTTKAAILHHASKEGLASQSDIEEEVD